MNRNSKFLILGAHGLVGSGIYRAFMENGIAAQNIDWQAASSFKRSFTDLLKKIYEEYKDTQIHFIWAAGAANFQSEKKSLINENDIFSEFLNILRVNNVGSLTYASSAGALYNEGRDVVDEGTEITNFSPYSESKIFQERLLQNFHEEKRVPTVVARISSVYGIRNKQNISQGIITNLIHANLIRKPIKIYVPLDLMRNYIHTDTVGNKLLSLTCEALKTNKLTFKIISSNRSVSIREIIRTIDKISRRPTPYLISQSTVSHFYGNFFCKSLIYPQIDVNIKDNLELNIHKILENIKQRLTFSGSLF